MKPEDGIVVKKDGNNVTFDTGEDEFIIKLDGDDDDSSDDDFGGMDSEMDSDVDSEMEEESLYEIELDESALKGLSKPKKVEAKESALKGLSKPKKVEAKESALKGLSKPKKVEAKEETEEVETEVDEASRTFGDGVRGPAQKKTYKAGRHEMNEEVENLKKQNAEYKKALVLFKDKLNEVAVFNANLAYATRLFTEHSTTKREKLTILKRFDGISTLSEAKNLFSQIKTELGTKTNVTESVVEKISNAPSTSSSQEVLSESKAYENPQFKRMKDLMSKIK
jgi:cation transport ATPase